MISVIICTYNRCARLRQMLESLALAKIPAGVVWELLVINNNSTDDTQAVVESFAGRLPIRHVFEGRQGKGHACNAALAIATGELLLFTDDDALVQEDWIETLWAAAQKYPEIGFFGGKVIPVWENPRPAWFDLRANPALGCAIVLTDAGETECRIAGVDFLPAGANMCFRRAVFDTIGLFRTDLGPHQRAGLLGDDSDVCLRALRAGCPGLYVPQALVKHPVPPERATKDYIWKYQVRYGRSIVLAATAAASQRGAAGCPRWIWRRVLQHGLGLVKTTLLRREVDQVRELVKLGFYWGQCREFNTARSSS